jgi:hypothetical protein
VLWDPNKRETIRHDFTRYGDGAAPNDGIAVHGAVTSNQENAINDARRRRRA